MEEALKIAVEGFKALGREVKETVRFIDASYDVYPDGRVLYASRDKEEAPLKHKILILHYLLSAVFKPEGGKLIDFKLLPGGLAYNPVFCGRVYSSILSVFGSNHRLFRAAVKKLGGEKADIGDAGARFTVFPGVPVYLGLFSGDDEFKPGCKVLFDENITEYFPTEDVIIICEILAKKLKESFHEQNNSGCR